MSFSHRISLKKMRQKFKNVILLTLVILLALAFYAISIFYERIQIPTTGMYPALNPKDQALFRPLIGSPKVSQIVCFDVEAVPALYKIMGQKERFISRVVALPGDHIAKEADHYTINGKPISKVLNISGLPPSTVTYPLVVPNGHIYTLSDNFSCSIDSRAYGLVPISAIRSVYWFTYWHAKANNTQ